MGRIKGFVIFVLLIVSAFFVYRVDIHMKKERSRQAMSVDNGEGKSELALKVDDAAIIKKALKAVGVLTVLEGEEEYRQVIEEERWYSYRAVNIDWHYKFGIAMDLEDIGIKVNNDVVNVTADREKLFVQFIEKTSDSTSRSDASLLAKQFTSQELDELEKAVLEKIKSQIELTPNYWDEALKSLETNIRKICGDLGYYNLNFIK